MSLLILNKDTYEVIISPEALEIECFAILVSRDKTKNKSIARKEFAYLYHMYNVRSDYSNIVDEKERSITIISDLGLPKDWKIDQQMTKAISFYKERNVTLLKKLYDATCSAVDDMTEYLVNTKDLLSERTPKGGAVTNINSIAGALEKVPKIMANVNAAYKQLVLEQQMLEGRKKGSKELNMFEDGV